MQVILNNVANKGINERVRVLLNIGGYKQKREQDLKELAEKIAGTVIRKGKSITLEPMTSYERKIIHAELQSNSKVETHSIGEEPNRKIVVSLKK
jgi:spoIIIJ-associated protein